MKTCIIIDDEPLAIQLLSSYVEKIEDLSLLGSFTNGIDGLSMINAQKPDIIFLDIQMPELTGIQIAKILGEDQDIILTTAYPEYALEGFEVNATDYLLKPITFERFLKAYNRLNKNKSAEPPLNQITENATDYIFVKTEHKHQRIEYDDILYFKGFGDYVIIQCKDSKILTLEKMKHFEAALPESKFVRVHKSYIVALNKIEYIEKNRIIIKNEYIAIGATYQEDFWKKVKK